MAAKLLHPILLCNDINPKSLIDVVDDEGCLLITCKSFIKRFCLSDRRQINSWLTNSWHPFTSGALRDHHSNKITCVISNSMLCQWNLEETNIESIKKYSFKSIIHKLVSFDEEIFVVYKCGFIETLTSAMSTRKEEKLQILQEDEKLLNIAIFTKNNTTSSMLFIEKEDCSYWLCKFNLGSQDMPASLKVHLANHQLMGSCLLSTGKLLTSWSDGNLYSRNTIDPEPSSNPGALQGSLNFFNKTKKIKMIELSHSHIALEGMDSNDDGGLIVLWDVKFGVNVSSKPMKMYRDPPLFWSIESGVAVIDGGVLAYIPVDLAPSTLSSMFASRTADSRSSNDCLKWGSSSSNPEKSQQNIFANKSSDLSEVVKLVAPGSTTEDMVVHLVITHLIEKKNLELVMECVTTFSFIPEPCIVDILKYLLMTENESFKNFTLAVPSKERCVHKRKSITKNNDASYCNDETIHEESSLQAFTSAFCEMKEKAINKILRLPFTEKQLTVQLHQFDFNSSWDLIQYLHHLLATGKSKIVEDTTDEFPSIATTSLWLSLLLDANYHQLVMTSETDIQRRLLNCEKDISNLKKFLEASHSIDPLVERVMVSKEMPVTQADASYSIERILLT